MKMDEIRVLAKNLGLKPGKKSKTDLVREIQVTEGNYDCFATEKSFGCDQEGCLWRGDCQIAAKKSQAA